MISLRFARSFCWKEVERSTYNRVSPEIWAKWAPAITALPRGERATDKGLEAEDLDNRPSGRATGICAGRPAYDPS